MPTRTPVTVIGLFALLVAWGGSLPGTEVSAAPGRLQAGPTPDARRSAAPAAHEVFGRYCVTCHNEKLKTGGLWLDDVGADVGPHAAVLEKVIRRLRNGTMPPEGRPRPDQATVEALITSLESALDRAAAAAPNPGRVISHRMNRTEYTNAVYDLLGLKVNGVELLPSDIPAHGFDNSADALAMTPALMARYVTAATKVSRLALASPDIRAMTQLSKVWWEGRYSRSSEQMPFATMGGAAVSYMFPLEGEYEFKIRLDRDLTGNIDGVGETEYEIELRLDRALLKRFVIGSKVNVLTGDDTLTLRLPVKAGEHLVTAGFTDAAPSPLHGLIDRRSGGNGQSQMAGIDMLSIAGPFNGISEVDTPSRRRIFTCRPQRAQDEEPCARQILTTLARRAYRRPVTASDMQPLMSLYEEGRRDPDFDAGIERAVEGLLASPKFLFRKRPGHAGATPGGVYRVDGLELASRLSFFLWRSLPDDELIELGARGTLANPEVLARQVRRMLADRRASRFMKDFSEQWLEVRNITSLTPDPGAFPNFDDTLRAALARETELFFESQIRADRPMPELLSANYTYLNDRLARHYGIAGVYGSHMRRVTLTDDRRQGLLGHGSILTVTSYANRTSVVVRGKWMLENLLGTPPPPPPPNVPPLKENDGKSAPTALRERMEQHRRNPVCASCHSQMDPLGFALEHFDGTGRWRDSDSGATINAAITWRGEKIGTTKAFRDSMVAKKAEFVRTVTEKLLTFAVGRGLEHSDAPTVRQLVRSAARGDYRWSSLIMGIVMSEPFQMFKSSSAPESAD